MSPAPETPGWNSSKFSSKARSASRQPSFCAESHWLTARGSGLRRNDRSEENGATQDRAEESPGRISPARKAAFHILLAVERGQSHSDDLLRGKAVNALSAPDRNLATALVLGVLRWQIQLDHQIRALLARPNAKLDPEVLIALRLGAFQLLHMDRIPARAAIDESVELAKQAGHRFASGMVNAVLRKLAKALQPKEVDLALKGHDFSRAAETPNKDAGFSR